LRGAARPCRRSPLTRVAPVPFFFFCAVVVAPRLRVTPGHGPAERASWAGGPRRSPTTAPLAAAASGGARSLRRRARPTRTSPPVSGRRRRGVHGPCQRQRRSGHKTVGNNKFVFARFEPLGDPCSCLKKQTPWARNRSTPLAGQALRAHPMGGPCIFVLARTRIVSHCAHGAC